MPAGSGGREQAGWTPRERVAGFQKRPIASPFLGDVVSILARAAPVDPSQNRQLETPERIAVTRLADDPD